MKRMVLFIAIAVLINGSAWVLGEPLKPFVFVHGGWRIASEPELGSAFESGFGFSIALAQGTRAVIDLGYAQHRVVVQDQGNKILYKNMTASLFLVCLQQELVLSPRFSINVSGGGGVVFTGLRDVAVVTIPEVTIKQSVPASFVLRLAGSLDFAVSPSVRVFGEAGYLYGRAKGTTRTYSFTQLAEQKELALTLSSLDLGLGIKYYF